MAMSVAKVEQSAATVGVHKTQNRSEWLQSWRRFRANRAALVAMLVIILITLMAIFADVLMPYDPNYSYAGMRGAGPSLEHPFGFDHIGRDLMTRVVYGARVALLVGLGASVISVVLGVVVGAISGYFGGAIDTVFSRIVDTLMAFPLLALLIVLAAVLGPSLTTTILVIGVTTWAALCARGARRCDGSAPVGLCDRGAGRRCAKRAHHLSAYPAQCVGAGDRAGHVGRRQHHHLGIVPLFLGAGYPAADRFVGWYPGRWALADSPISPYHCFPRFDDLYHSLGL